MVPSNVFKCDNSQAGRLPQAEARRVEIPAKLHDPCPKFLALESLMES